MPRMCSWDAPLGQTRREAAAGAAIISSKLSFRPATRARRPSTPRARGGARDPSPTFVPTCADGAFDGAHKRTRTARYGWSRVRLCTRHKAACAETAARPPESASMCPTLHTPERPVCRNGQERRDMAGHVSDFAHARTPRVQKRTRTARYGRLRVRLCTRLDVPCAQTDTSCPHSPRGRPLAHAAALVRARMRTSRRQDRPPRVRRGTRTRDARKVGRDPPSPSADTSACARRGFSRALVRTRRQPPRTRAPRRGPPETGAHHARLVARSTNNRALRAPSRTPSPRKGARACHPVVCGTVTLAEKK